MRRSQRQHGSDRSPHSSRPKKPGFGPHLLPGLRPKPCAFDSAAECVEANASTVPTAVSILSVRKSGQVLVRTYVLKYVEFPRILGGMSGVLNLQQNCAVALGNSR